MILEQHLPVLIIVAGLLGAFLTPLLGLVNKKLCNPWSTVVTAVQLALSLLLLHTVMKGGSISYWLGGWEPPWGIEYYVDLLNAFVLVIVAFVCFSVSIYARRSNEAEVPGKEIPFYTVYLLLTTGMLGIVVTGDIFNLYVFLEIASLAAYALIAVGDRHALMASFNYMIMGTISACFILIGIGYFYIVTGSLNMADLHQLLPPLYDSPVVLAALVLLIVGLSIKVALFPLHTWLPDAYTHAPSSVSAVLSGTFTKVGVYAIIRIMFTVLSPEYVIETVPVADVLAWVAAIAIIMGSVLAIAQYDIKRMLAYSTVSQVGYMVLGIGMATKIAIMGGIFHILAHAMMKTGLFLVAGAIIYRTGIRNIYQLKGMGKKMPFTMAAFIIGALSMIGIPPTLGFVSKLLLGWGAFEGGHWVFLVVILVSSLLNAVYFWRVFENAYYGVHEDVEREEAPPSMLVPIMAFAVITVVLGILALIPIGVIEPWVEAVLS
ncbi:MAG: monovalent cation/H+ antiporter subunit D family protein [Methermicoccaceae archaeon]